MHNVHILYVQRWDHLHSEASEQRSNSNALNQ